MFQTLQPNQKLYIFHKMGTPRLEEGIVQNVSPMRMQQPSQIGGMPTPMVDVTVLVNGQTFPYTLPANAVVGTLRDNGGIVVSMSREALSNEVKNHKQNSIDIINSVEYHNGVIAACDTIWQQLNPEAMEKERQTQEINSLKEQMSTMTANMAQLMEMNRKLMEGLNSGGNSKKQKENA